MIFDRQLHSNILEILTRKKVFYVAIYSLLIFYILILFSYYLKSGFSDFNFYWDAGVRISQNVSPYKSHDLASYVNGPLLAISLSFLSSLNASWIVLVWRIGILLSTFLLGLKILFKPIPKNWQANGPIVFSILFLSFPFRNNLGNVQVVVFVTLLLYLFIYLTRANKEWLGTVPFLMAFELKPYLVIYLLLVLVWKRKTRYLFKLIIISTLLNLFYFFTFNHLSYFVWLKAILYRGHGILSSNDQSTLVSALTNIFHLPGKISFLISTSCMIVVIILSSIKIRSFSLQDSMVFVMAASPLIGFFSHEQDYFVSSFALAYFFIKQRNKDQAYLFYFLTAFSVNWSNKSILPGLVCLVVFLLTSILSNRTPRRFSMSTFFIISGLVSIQLNHYVIQKYGTNFSFLWHNFSAYLYGLAVLCYIIRAPIQK